MYSQGLSLDQAPPISVILRFFLSVPFFGLLFSMTVLYGGEDLLQSHTPIALAAVHLLFIGVIAMTMAGALFQMLPVLAGVVIRVPAAHATRVHLLLVLGTLLLVTGFATFHTGVLVTGGVLLGAALLYLITLMLPPLVKQKGDTVRGMQMALLYLAVALLLALVLLYALATGSAAVGYDLLRRLHFSFALFGWIGMLIIAVAYQVIEMFYVTPSYPEVCKRYLWIFLFAALVGKSLCGLLQPSFELLFDAVTALILLAFVAVTLRRLTQRRRPIADTTVWFWRSGMAMLALAVMLWLIGRFDAPVSFGPAMLVAYALFVLSVLFGMMYKIVPFLVWFHLNSQGYFDAPVMNEIITARQARGHYYLFVTAALTLLAGVWIPLLIHLSGLLFFVMFALLGYNLYTALRIYRRVRRDSTPMKMDFKTV